MEIPDDVKKACFGILKFKDEEPRKKNRKIYDIESELHEKIGSVVGGKKKQGKGVFIE